MGTMDGVKVIEVADYVFVPAAGGLLADWGADVIKIEHHETGDPLRGLSAFFGTADVVPKANAVLEAANRGKRSLGLNLATPQGRDILCKLVERSDVFLTSKLEATRRKLGISVEDLRQANPDIIYVKGSGHGERGPDGGTGGFDILDFWNRSGIALGTKAFEAEFLPFMPSSGYGDFTGAMYMVSGIAAALFHRERTGEALTVHASLLAAGMWTISGGITQSALYEVPCHQEPAEYAVNPLVNTYRASDGTWICIACLQAQNFWPDVCEVIDRPDLIDYEWYLPGNLAEGRPAVAKILVHAFGQHPYEHWRYELSQSRINWARVQDTLEVTTDPQALENDYLVTTASSDGQNELLLVAPPVQFEEQPAQVRPAPRFNAHGDAILGELGLDIEEILDLKLKNVVA
jgi:crotonobetainyl-CoA:carnitine CoA-transferase CaiB-like acyl-CoA transferase